MKKNEALEILNGWDAEDSPSAINPSLSQKQVKEIMIKGWNTDDPDFEISHLLEKRVWQCVRNQRRPKF